MKLAIGEKNMVTTKVEGFHIEKGGRHIKMNLNLFPLGSYDVLILMDWLEGDWSVLNCKEKTISFLNDEGFIQGIHGIKRAIKLRYITTNQLCKCIQRGYQISVVWVGYTN